MLEGEQKFKLSDIIDINFLQEFQDVFAATTNVASITVDDRGSITKPSNFTEFCIKFTRGNALGLKKCVECDIKWGKLAAVRGEPVIYKCHTGLTDFAVPIVVDGKHIASILGGQVLTEPPNEEHFREIARQLSIDEDEYIKAVKKIKIVPEETVKAAAHLLFLVANAISEIGLKNLRLKEKGRKEEFYRLVMETVMGTLDIEETKKKVVDIIGKTLGADRCFIAEYDKKNDKFLIVKDEYLSSDKVASYVGADPSKEIPNFAEALKKGKPLIINNKEISLDTKNEDFGLEKAAIEKFDVNSAFGFPLYYINEFLGVLSIHYVDKNRSVTDEDITLVTMISTQVATLIHQANLYKSIQLRGEREGLYRNIMEAVRSSLDIKKTKKHIVKVVCESLSADRCFIVDFDKKNNKFLKVKDEYLSSKDVLPFSGVDVNTEIPNIANAVKNGKNLIINDREIYMESDNKDYDLEKKAIEKFGVNSAFAFPLYYSDELLGALAIHYVKTQHTITDEEIGLLNNIANQISLAIHQANLYAQLNQKSKDQDAILNNMPFMAWLKDDNGNLLAVNEVYAKMCNQKPEDIVGKTDFDFFPKEYAESYTLEDRLVMDTKQTIPSEDLIVGPDGESWHETFKSPVFDNKGKVIGTVGISQDITERKNLEVANVKNKDQLNAILDNIPYWAWLKDKENRYILVNKKYAEDKQMAQGDFVGKTDFDLYPTELAELYLKNDTEVVETGKQIKIEEETLLNGEPRILETYKQPFLNTNGEIIGTVGIAKDITERKETELELLHKQSQIVKAAEREVILRKTITTIRSSMDVNLVKREMVTQIGAFLEADRVAFADYDFKKENYITREGNEYRSSDDVRTFVGYDFAGTPGFIEAIRQVHLTGKDIIFSDLDKYLEENNLLGTGAETFYREMGFNSSMAINVSYGDNFYGNIVVTFEQKKEITEADIKFLKTLADQSGIAIYQTTLYQKEKETTERERLIGAVVSKTISTFDINEIKQIVKEIGIITHADRCYFVEIDLENMKGKPIDYEGEYLASDDIKSIIGYDFSREDVEKFLEAFLMAEDLVVFDYEKILEEQDEKYAGIKRYCNLFGLKNSIGIPFFYNDKLKAVIAIEYVKEKVLPNEDELEFLRILANQAGMAFEQAQLYQEAKKIARREALLRNITVKIRSSLDLDEILSFICEETAKLFNVQRTAITFFSGKGNYNEIILREEYKTDSVIKGYRDMVDYPGLASYWEQNLVEMGQILAFDNVDESNVPDYFKNGYNEIGVKSVMGGVVKLNDRELGILVLSEYNKNRHWSDEEKSLLTAIASQIFIAINQAELYNTVQKTAEVEKALRDVMLSSVNTSEMKEALNAIVTEAGKLLKADRCFFVEISHETNSNLQVETYAEYLSSPDIKSHSTRPIEKGDTTVFVNFTNQKKMIFADDVAKENLPEATRRLLIDDLSVKSYLNTPVFHGDTVYGSIVFHYVNEYKHFTQDEIDVAQAIANQSAIVIHKAKLFELTQSQAQREALLRRTFEAMRSSLDINNIKTSIVTEVCKAIGADRCFIIEYDKDNDEFLVISDEYLASEDIPSYRGTNVNVDVPNFAATLKRGENIIVNNREIYMDADPQKVLAEKEAIEKYKVNSAFAFPLYYSDELLGAMAIHYVDREHTIVSDEINLLNIIANQISIAIHQAKLYKLTQIQAEREKISRSIVEILRSSLDKKTIKRLFVKNIGKYFYADRVFFSDYDMKSKVYLPVDEYSEYLSGPEVKSFVGYDWSCEEAREYIQPLLEKRELKIPEWNEYLTQNQKSQEFISLFEDANVKSSYNFPVLYQDKTMGYFCVEFTHKVNRLSEEDINRIRSMCTQSGIALYQAELYQKVQESDRVKGEFITNISNKFREPLNNIIEFSAILPKASIDCEKQTEYLNTINETGKKLLDFTNYIQRVSEERPKADDN